MPDIVERNMFFHLVLNSSALWNCGGTAMSEEIPAFCAFSFLCQWWLGSKETYQVQKDLMNGTECG